MLGAEGFRLEDSYIVPDLNYIADFSSLSELRRSDFLRKSFDVMKEFLLLIPSDDDIFLEFVLVLPDE